MIESPLIISLSNQVISLPIFSRTFSVLTRNVTHTHSLLGFTDGWEWYLQVAGIYYFLRGHSVRPPPLVIDVTNFKMYGYSCLCSGHGLLVENFSPFLCVPCHSTYNFSPYITSFSISLPPYVILLVSFHYFHFYLPNRFDMSVF